MKKFIKDYSIIAIFLLFLYIPTISFFFLKDKIETVNTENRKLATKPEITFSEITEYPSKYSDYYNDNLPYRSNIKQLWTNINFDLFNESTDDRVVVGKNDGTKDTTWLFYNNKIDGDPISYVRNEKVYTENELKDFKNNILENISEFKKKGIELFYLVIPNKSTVYSEFLPDSISILNNENRSTQLNKYLLNNGIRNYLYIYDALEEASKKHETYLRQDTHWNNYGAFIGTKELVKMIENKDFFENIIIKDNGLENHVGDLIDFAGLKKDFKSANIVIDIDNSNIETKTEGKYVHTYNSVAKIDKVILFVGDSFREAIIPYLSSIYKEVIYMHRADYNVQCINEYNPEIVIRQWVERYEQDVASKLGLPT